MGESRLHSEAAAMESVESVSSGTTGKSAGSINNIGPRCTPATPDPKLQNPGVSQPYFIDF
jgi:hypothetical protein